MPDVRALRDTGVLDRGCRGERLPEEQEETVMRNNWPTKFDDLIDSRSVVAAIEELDEGDEERPALEALAEEGASATADWRYGATLVRDTYFVEYAKELADEMALLSDVWPLHCIDWQRAAAELRMDYTPIEFDGVTYWVR